MNQSEVISICFSFVLYFSIGLLGAFTNDLYETLVKKDETIKISRIFIGAITTAVLFLYVEPFIADYSMQTKFVFCFISGVLGFEIFGKVNNLNGLYKVLDIINNIKK